MLPKLIWKPQADRLRAAAPPAMTVAVLVMMDLRMVVSSRWWEITGDLHSFLQLPPPYEDLRCCLRRLCARHVFRVSGA
ncbi:hypothetical protein CJ198_09080 [Brevibacterium luteolum]|uniref:Uncharacterized protein n=1 Tax=Brevibacterium luteolum TaxID=199591 RepID=A0A2N6PH02_9MICO|nr:hypothetical protein CJ198_09080 [Brevibacterium luteolum]